MQYCTGILGHRWGVRPPAPPLPKQRWGQGSPASPLAQALAGDVQSFLCFALIPHPSKQAGFLRPRYALFIGPPGHASGQPGERSLSIPAPDGRALITPVLRVTVRSRQRRLPKAAFRGSLLNKNVDLSGKESGRNGITTSTRAHGPGRLLIQPLLLAARNKSK